MARALVARGRARKGAGQKLLLMASRGLSHLFVLLRTYTADCVPSSHPFYCVLDFQTASTVDPSNRELQFHWRQEPVVRPCPSQFQTRPLILIFLDPLLRRRRPPTPSARNLGPDRELRPPILPPHLALCIFISPRHRPPTHLPYGGPLSLRRLGQLEPNSRHLRQSQGRPSLFAPDQSSPGSLVV